MIHDPVDSSADTSIDTSTQGSLELDLPGLLSRLQGCVRGHVASAEDPAYADAAPWNQRAAFAPAAVVYPEDSDDVTAVVLVADQYGLSVTVQSTGHGGLPSTASTIVVHTSRLDACVINTERRTARLGAGVRAEQLLAAAGEHGLAPLIGSAGSVGVVGYLTGGGVGPMSTTFGLSADKVRSLRVVTGEGSQREVTPHTDPDLFWGLRGGKSALGVVTEVTIDLEPLAQVYGGALWFSGDNASPVLQTWSRWAAALPEQVSTSVAVQRLPPGPSAPPALQSLAGQIAVSVRVVSVLDSQDTEDLLGPVRRAAPVLLDTVEVFPYRDIARVHGEPTSPMPLVQDQSLLDALDADGVSAVLEGALPELDAGLSMVELRHLGGALARAPEHASAFSFRDSPFAMTVTAVIRDGDESAATAATRRALGAVATWAAGKTMVNFVAPDDPERVAMAYDRATLDRLHRLIEIHNPRGTVRSSLLPARRVVSRTMTGAPC